MQLDIYMKRRKEVGDYAKKITFITTYSLVYLRSCGHYEIKKIKITRKRFNNVSVKVGKRKKLKKIIKPLAGFKYNYITEKGRTRELGSKVSHAWFIRSVLCSGKFQQFTDLKYLVSDVVDMLEGRSL